MIKGNVIQFRVMRHGWALGRVCVEMVTVVMNVRNAQSDTTNIPKIKRSPIAGVRNFNHSRILKSTFSYYFYLSNYYSYRYRPNSGEAVQVVH